jgi:hypothetical protein
MMSTTAKSLACARTNHVRADAKWNPHHDSGLSSILYTPHFASDDVVETW